MRRAVRCMVVALLFCAAVEVAHAQTVLGEGPRNKATQVKDASMLKPPAGAKVAVVEWTDMECPFCAYAFPVVRAAAARARIPVVHYDFIIPGHQWSPQAELFARYLRDKVSPEMELEYRREVFARQRAIATREDLDGLTRAFMAAHGKAMPFVVDPDDRLKKEVLADHNLGLRMGLTHTPTIFVVTRDRWIDVANVQELDHAIQMAEAEAGQSAGRKMVGKK
jgi:protein-disulfide isomerase